MKEADFSIGWRQVRIFTSDFSDQWYLGILAAFAVPLSNKYPRTAFFFSRYALPINSGDDGDTKIDQLPPNFLQPKTNNHFSVRLRFCPNSDEEAYLESLFTATHWHSTFLPYDGFSEFSSGRFCSCADIASRIRRASVLIHLLHTNCLFVLDMMQNNGGKWQFETNADGLNRFCGNSFQSVMHMASQVTGIDGTNPLPLYWHDKATGKYVLTAMT